MRAIFVFLTTACLSACASLNTSPSCASGTMIETRLYFGLSIPGGGRVSDRAFETFVGNEIIPRLPEGFTVMNAHGVWRDEQSKRTVTEDTKVLIRLHENTETSIKQLDEIASAYKLKFRQDSVLRTDQSVCAAF